MSDKETNPTKEFGKRLQRVRKLRAMTQQDLAKNSGLDLSTVQKLEGGISTGREETRQRLAQALKVTLSYLVYGVEEATNSARTISVPDNLSNEDLTLLEDYAEFLSQRRTQKEQTSKRQPFEKEEATIYTEKLLRRIRFFRQRNVPTALDLEWIENTFAKGIREAKVSRAQVLDLLEVVNKEIFQFLHPQLYRAVDFSWDELEDVNDLIARELDL